MTTEQHSGQLAASRCTLWASNTGIPPGWRNGSRLVAVQQLFQALTQQLSDVLIAVWRLPKPLAVDVYLRGQRK